MTARATTLPLGFQWSSTKAGIKASGKPDVALAICPGGATAAALFTRNQVVAAPVTVGRRHLAATSGKVSALVVNAGNANCATGEAGLDACRKSCIAVGDQFGCVFDEVFPSSTGIIGVPFPTEKLLTAIPSAAAALGDTREHAEAFAAAILTTDTKLKVALATIEVGDKAVQIFGCAKGAGMIGPNLGGPPHATMLAYIFTDIAACSEHLDAMLTAAVETSFNCISIDGDTSTNDTVLLLASGKSGIAAQGEVVPAFEAALQRVCDSLAHQIIDDGEGVTHVVTLEITGARTDAEAKAIAATIAASPLCKTAWSSADPNWGRLLAAAGRAGVAFDPATVTIRINDLPIFERGLRDAAFDEAATHHISIRTALANTQSTSTSPKGPGHCRFLTCDLDPRVRQHQRRLLNHHKVFRL